LERLGVSTSDREAQKAETAARRSRIDKRPALTSISSATERRYCDGEPMF